MAALLYTTAAITSGAGLRSLKPGAMMGYERTQNVLRVLLTSVSNLQRSHSFHKE